MTLDALLEQAKRPGLFLRKTPEADGPGAPGCWLGGAPSLPARLEWPTFAVSGLPEVPMHFVAQIDLAQAPRAPGPWDMPARGTLFFFYDTIFAPVVGLGAEGGRVLFAPGDVSEAPLHPTPAFPDVTGNPDVSFWYSEAPTTGYRKWSVTFESMLFYDDALFDAPEFWPAASARNMDEDARLRKLTRKDRSRGSVEGWSNQFAAHRMFGDDALGATRPSDDMVPLLTVESDDDLGFTHGDRVPIMFLIKGSDLAAGTFDRIHVTERYG